MKKIFLSNAFSLQMLGEFPASVRISEVSREEIPVDAVSIVGHKDTAAVLGVPMNRQNITLKKGDVLYVAQLQGGRLPEGATSLPEGYSFKFLKVEVE